MAGTRVRVFADGSVLTMFDGCWTLHLRGDRFITHVYALEEVEHITI